MKLAIGNDHAAVDLKFEVMEHLKSRGIEVVNVGTDTSDRFNYPVAGYKVAKMVAASGDYAVYDFKPGRNTFLDAETDEVRFIDPRIDINDPSDNFAYSRFGKRRRTDAGFDAERQLEAMRDVERGGPEDAVLTAEDEARMREQEEADAALEDLDFDGLPFSKPDGAKFETASGDFKRIQT